LDLLPAALNYCLLALLKAGRFVNRPLLKRKIKREGSNGFFHDLERLEASQRTFSRYCITSYRADLKPEQEIPRNVRRKFKKTTE
jgi:hypothetical protein